MTWVKKDDLYPINRKVSVLSDAAYRLDDEALCWASRNHTDGRIAADELGGISKRGIPKNAAELVRRRRWHRAEDPACPSEYCPTPGPTGWVIHDYLEYNPSAAEVIEDRRKKAERQRNWRMAKSGRNASRNASTSGERDGPRDALVGQSRDGPRDALVGVLVDPAPRAHVSRPVPSRPAPKEGGSGAPAATTARPVADGAAGGGRKDRKPGDVAAEADPPNGRPVRPPDTSELRKTLAEARRRARGGAGPPGEDAQVNGPTALQRLRELTPDVAAFVEPEQAAAPTVEGQP